VPFLRFSRDKRGYENIYLVHTPNRRGKPLRPRVLYWYRTPPGVRVGRPPFDEEARRRIEAQYPDVTFDWPTIVATPMPPPAENEQWRERRRAERAAKQAQRAEEDATLRADRHQTPEVPDAMEPDVPALEDDTLERPLSPEIVIEEIAQLEREPQLSSDDSVPTEIASGASETVALQAASDRPQEAQPGKRRRRGGRRRRRGHGAQLAGQQGPQATTSPGGTPVAPPASEHESIELSPDSESGDFDANEE
jgi:hypothetical protein